MDWKYYGMIERGELNSTLETIEKLAKAFGVEVCQLFVFSSDGSSGEIKMLEKEFKRIISTSDDDVKRKILKIAQLFASG